MSTLVAEASKANMTEDQQIPAEIISAEIVAVIAAAATALAGRGIRIRSIDPPQSSHQRLSRWTQQGRASVQTSHNLKRKR